MSERKIAGVLVAAVVLAASGAFAARPLIIDDADPLEFKDFKIEGGGWCEKDAGCKHWDIPFGVGCGIFPSVELGAGFGGQFEERTEVDEESCEESNRSVDSIGDLVVNAKWQFRGESKWLPRQAIVPAVKFPTSDKDKGLGSGKTDYDLTWIASKSVREKIGAHINIGYSWIGETDDEDAGDILHYGLALDYKIVAPLQWVGEMYAEDELRHGINTVVMFNTGLRYSILDSLVADIAAGSRIAGDAPELTATAGLTWTFGFAKNEQQEKK
ncbi:MAG: transporter [Kiritimatiellia bacterium]